jgi:hypothetical protein
MNTNLRTNLAYALAALVGIAILTFCFFSQTQNQVIDSTAVGGGMMALVMHYRNNRKQRQA